MPEHGDCDSAEGGDEREQLEPDVGEGPHEVGRLRVVEAKPCGLLESWARRRRAHESVSPCEGQRKSDGVRGIIADEKGGVARPDRKVEVDYRRVCRPAVY